MDANSYPSSWRPHLGTDLFMQASVFYDVYLKACLQFSYKWSNCCAPDIGMISNKLKFSTKYTSKRKFGVNKSGLKCSPTVFVNSFFCRTYHRLERGLMHFHQYRFFHKPCAAVHKPYQNWKHKDTPFCQYSLAVLVALLSQQFTKLRTNSFIRKTYKCPNIVLLYFTSCKFLVPSLQ